MSTRQHAPAHPATTADREPSGLRVEPTFSGSWTSLDRLGTVRPGTVVLVAAAGRPDQLKAPGEVLVPSWPFAPQIQVLVVNTRSVTLPVRVDHLATLDGEELDCVELDVELRLDESQLLAVAPSADEDLDARLVLDARRAIETSVRAAVGLNRAADLRRQPLATVLEDHWLPATFVSGVLVRVGLRVRRVGWPDEPEEPPLPPRRRSGSSVAPMPLEVAALASRRRHAPPSVAQALRRVYVPAIISVGTFWLFFVGYWIPELRSLPGPNFVLEQLAPIASVDLTSRSQPLVASQAGHSGIPAAFLLLVSLLLPALARARYWLARLAMWPLTYLAAVCAAVTIIGTAVRGRLAADLVGVLLLMVWVAASVVTTWRSLWVDVDHLPPRPGRVLWLLLAFAFLSPAPIAVGRSIFASQLRTAATTVMHNDLALRWAALLTPATALVYLSGLLLGALIWAVYELWPPRPAGPITAPVVVLVAAVLALALIGPQAGQAAAHRSETMRTQSPRAELGFTCGVWTQPGQGQVVETLVVSGLSCRHVTVFHGYQEVASRSSDFSMSPVRAETLAGRRIAGKIVSGQYPQLVVLAATDRLDNRATRLVALRIDDGQQLWGYSCPSGTTLNLRLAGTLQGDDSSLGRLTLPGEDAGILAQCGSGTVRLDAATGRPERA